MKTKKTKKKLVLKKITITKLDREKIKEVKAGQILPNYSVCGLKCTLDDCP